MLMDPSSEFQPIRSMWYIVALKINTFADSFLMVFIEPSHEVCRKALHWQVKRPSAIADVCSKRFGLTIIRPYLACIGA